MFSQSVLCFIIGTCYFAGRFWFHIFGWWKGRTNICSQSNFENKVSHVTCNTASFRLHAERHPQKCKWKSTLWKPLVKVPQFHPWYVTAHKCVVLYICQGTWDKYTPAINVQFLLLVINMFGINIVTYMQLFLGHYLRLHFTAFSFCLFWGATLLWLFWYR